MFDKIPSVLRSFRKTDTDEEEQQFLRQFSVGALTSTADPMPEGLTQVGFIGRDREKDRPSKTVFGALRQTRIRHPFRIVSFYTEDNEYAEHAARLRNSAARFGLECHMRAVRSAGSWERNCAFKAEFILEEWTASPDPIVWIDADATFESAPVLFAAVDADVGLHKWTWENDRPHDGWQFASGTLYFGKSERTRFLLEQWVLRCRADPMTWDQVHLCSAWCDVNTIAALKTVWLPRSYLQIDGAPEFDVPVVKHWQASRKLRVAGKTSHSTAFEITEQGMADRRLNRLWRTPEELFWIAEGTAHIKPEIGLDFPEGFDIARELRAAIGGKLPVLEIGCGVGRIASLFEPSEYLGVDVNPTSLLQARTFLPDHTFRIHDRGYKYPATPSVLFYTVLLHVSDEALEELLSLAAARCERLVIAELMDRRWRREGNPPVFNRDPEDYILAMQKCNFGLVSARKREYERYAKEPWNVGRDSRLTILSFEPYSHGAQT
jgi:hypothetical protein